MAKVFYLDPIDHISGKISKQTRTTYMHRTAATANPAMLANPNFTHICGKRTTAVSQSEVAYRTRFGAICKATRQRMQDASKMPADIAAFKAQRQYTTLYQFVWHQVADTIE